MRPPMLFKLRPCIKNLCNVYHLPTPSISWIGQIKGCSLVTSFSLERFLVSVFHAFRSWLRFGAGCRDAQNWCSPMPTQNPWVGVGMGMGTQCRALQGRVTMWMNVRWMNVPSAGIRHHRFCIMCYQCIAYTTQIWIFVLRISFALSYLII